MIKTNRNNSNHFHFWEGIQGGIQRRIYKPLGFGMVDKCYPQASEPGSNKGRYFYGDPKPPVGYRVPSCLSLPMTLRACPCPVLYKEVFSRILIRDLCLFQNQVFSYEFLISHPVWSMYIAIRLLHLILIFNIYSVKKISRFWAGILEPALLQVNGKWEFFSTFGVRYERNNIKLLRV